MPANFVMDEKALDVLRIELATNSMLDINTGITVDRSLQYPFLSESELRKLYRQPEVLSGGLLITFMPPKLEV